MAAPASSTTSQPMNTAAPAAGPSRVSEPVTLVNADPALDGR